MEPLDILGGAGSGSDASDKENDDLNTLKFNAKYQQRFTKRKEEQEVAYARKLMDDQDIASDSEDESSEDEDGALLNDEVEETLDKTLQMIRNKDKKIYDPNFKAFSSSAFFDERKGAGASSSSSSADAGGEGAPAEEPKKKRGRLQPKQTYANLL